MLHKLLVIVHLFGAAIWIGGHSVLLATVLPKALRERNPGYILDFERDYEKLGLAALALQVGTGLWLATIWVGDWRTVFSSPTPAAHLVLTKIAVLLTIVALSVHASWRVLPRISAGSLRPFAIHAWAVTALSAVMLILGASIRFGGLF